MSTVRSSDRQCSLSPMQDVIPLHEIGGRRMGCLLTSPRHIVFSQVNCSALSGRQADCWPSRSSTFKMRPEFCPVFTLRSGALSTLQPTTVRLFHQRAPIFLIFSWLPSTALTIVTCLSFSAMLTSHEDVGGSMPKGSVNEDHCAEPRWTGWH